jgi:hypothetical protein
MRDMTRDWLRAGLIATALAGLVVSQPRTVAAAAVEKVSICHIPPGNPENAHTIVVGAPAVPAHLAHGDTAGACGEGGGEGGGQ